MYQVISKTIQHQSEAEKRTNENITLKVSKNYKIFSKKTIYYYYYLRIWIFIHYF